jgi:hypothetical protein
MSNKLFELKPCPQCKGTGDAHHQGHYYDCGDCLGTGYEEPQGRIINLELMLNEHKMALKSSDAHNNDLAQKLEIAWEQRDRLMEAMTRIVNIYENPEKGCIPSSSDMYDEALQSLTTNEQ